jgi:trans-aconitate methyltransferase
MTAILEVSSEWLSLREPEDAAARSRDLALAAAEMLQQKPLNIHDLGSGTGSMMRWLAPLLPGQQTWTLHDWNSDLIEQAARGIRPLDRDNDPISVCIQPGDLADLRPADLHEASLVTASALLDVLTVDEIQAIVDACLSARCTTLLSLSVTGDVQLSPADERDAAFQRAFNAHQVREAATRRQVGRHGAAIAKRLFADAGWHVRSSTTTWRLDHDRPRLLAEWFEGWVDASLECDAELRAEAAGYRRRRAAEIERGELTARIRHLDLLAWPRG